MPDDVEAIPTFGDWLAGKLGFQLPTLIPLPQARKNFDKAVGSVWAALGKNVAARIDTNTAKTKAKGKIEVDDLFETTEQKRKVENRAKTLSAAAEDLEKNGPKTDAPSEIDDDWLNLFNRIAEDKSSEELQSLFGRILSGEIRRPGTYSLRTVQFLSTLSKNEATAVSNFMSFVVGRNFVPLPKDDKIGPAYAVRSIMEELGIAGQFSGLVTSWSAQILPQKMMVLAGTDFGVVIENGTDHELALNVPCQALTNLGKELIDIANPAPTEIAFLEDVGHRLVEDFRGTHPDDVAAGQVKVNLAKTIHAGGDLYRCFPIRTIGT